MMTEGKEDEEERVGFSETKTRERACQMHDLYGITVKSGSIKKWEIKLLGNGIQ